MKYQILVAIMTAFVSAIFAYYIGVYNGYRKGFDDCAEFFIGEIESGGLE